MGGSEVFLLALGSPVTPPTRGYLKRENTLENSIPIRNRVRKFSSYSLSTIPFARCSSTYLYIYLPRFTDKLQVSPASIDDILKNFDKIRRKLSPTHTLSECDIFENLKGKNSDPPNGKNVDSDQHGGRHLKRISTSKKVNETHSSTPL